MNATWHAFVMLPDGRHAQVEVTSPKKGIAIAIAVGKKRDSEGTKTVWRDLPEQEQFFVEL